MGETPDLANHPKKVGRDNAIITPSLGVLFDRVDA